MVHESRSTALLRGSRSFNTKVVPMLLEMGILRYAKDLNPMNTPFSIADVVPGFKNRVL